MGSSSGFGSTPCDTRPIQTRFRCGSAYHSLNRPQRVTRRIILQKARRQRGLTPLRLRLHGSRRFQGLFHSPRRGTFHRSLTVLCAIGRCVYVALGGGPPSFTPDCSCPALLKSRTAVVVAVGYPAVTVCGDAFQASSPSNSAPRDGWPSVVCGLPTLSPQGRPAWHGKSLGIARFARRYYGHDFCSTGYMRCFSSPGAPRQ
jgi:hypothetical protein